MYQLEFVKLTDEQRQFFDKNGYLVVPDVLSSKDIDQLTAACDRMIEAFDQDSSYVQQSPGIVVDTNFHPLLAWSPTVPLITQLLSPNIHLHTTAIIYKRSQKQDKPEIVNQRGWHRDIGITEDLGHDNLLRVGIKVGYCLTDFPQPRSGFTMFASGSHLLPTPLPIPRGKVDPSSVLDLCLKAGDAFLFENRIFHTSAPNLSPRTSKVIILGYSYRWMGGRKTNMQQVQPSQKILDQVDPIRQQLLGGESDAVIHWAKENDFNPSASFQWTTEI